VLSSGGPLTLYTNKAPTTQIRKTMLTFSNPTAEDRCASAFDFDPTDNNLFTVGSMNGEIMIRKNAPPRDAHVVHAHTRPIYDVKFLKKRILITADGDGNVKLWNVIATSNATRFSVECKLEIPGQGEQDNVSIQITPQSKPMDSTTSTTSSTTSTSPLDASVALSYSDNDTFLIKRSNTLQLWKADGTHMRTWSVTPPEPKAKKADTLTIKDSKYSGNGMFIYVLLSDDSLLVLDKDFCPQFKASLSRLLAPGPQSKSDPKEKHEKDDDDDDDDDEIEDSAPTATCLATNPHVLHQIAVGGNDGNVYLIDLIAKQK